MQYQIHSFSINFDNTNKRVTRGTFGKRLLALRTAAGCWHPVCGQSETAPGRLGFPEAGLYTALADSLWRWTPWPRVLFVPLGCHRLNQGSLDIPKAGVPVVPLEGVLLSPVTCIALRKC